MGSEAASLRMMDHTTLHSHTYEILETSERLAVIAQHIVTTQVQQVALVSIALSFETEGRFSNAHLAYKDPDACTLYLLQSIRPLVRKTDKVCLFDNTLYFFLLGANLDGGLIVQNRLWDALLWRIHNTSEGEIVQPRSIVSGYSAYPAPCNTFEEFIESASQPSLRANFGTEKLTRKAVTRQARTTQRQITDEELPALARKLGIPYLSLLPPRPSERVQQLVNPKLAQELHCYPLGRERNVLTVAMLDPQDHHALERLHQETGLDIFPVLTCPHELQTALEQLI
ncbi:MAG: hypothetical protein ACJ788_11640 [Ktedonobacteraceae bacterium]